jgi:hypothetical protein
MNETQYKKQAGLYPMYVQVKPNSDADVYWRKKLTDAIDTTALAPGIKPSVSHNLVDHGGNKVPDMQFKNIYVNGLSSWIDSDRANIDTAISAAMTDSKLDSVVAQYFPAQKSQCTKLDSILVSDTAKRSRFGRADVKTLLGSIIEAGELKGIDLTKTIFNFLLPQGAVLFIDDTDTSDSTHGLGGYHGSLRQDDGTTSYYSVAVYSQTTANGENGIPAFDQPWKNVVATCYHELNEFRTDPDVESAIADNNNSLLGWTSSFGEEIGDFPIFEATALSQVFKELTLPTKLVVPVQLLYSNRDNGPELPN